MPCEVYKPYHNQKLAGRPLSPASPYHKWILWNGELWGGGWYQLLFDEYGGDNADVQFDSVSGSRRNNDGGTYYDLNDTEDEDEEGNRMVDSETDTDNTDGPIVNGHAYVGVRCDHIDDTVWDVCNDWSFHPTCLTNAMDSVFIDTYTCITTDLSAEVLHASFRKYPRVCLKELGIRISQQHQIKKKLAHCKQVLLEEVAGLPPTKKQKTIPEAATSTSSNPQHTSAPSAVTPAEDTEEQTYYCSVCGGKYVSGTRFNWIECSSCEKWSHRKCDWTLKKPKAWLHAQKDGVEYNCPPCKTR